METPPTIYLRPRGRVLGPFTPEQVRELMAGGAVSAESEAAAAPEGPWGRLEALPEGASIFARSVLKEREFERIETKGGEVIRLADLIAAAQTPAKNPGGASAAAKPVSAEHDVRALLQFNHELEKRRGLFRLAPRPAGKSRRKRDYWLLVAGVGVLFFGVLIAEAVIAVAVQTLAAKMPDQFWPIFWQVLFHSPILGWGLAMYAVVVVALTWLMFGLMDDY